VVIVSKAPTNPEADNKAADTFKIVIHACARVTAFLVVAVRVSNEQHATRLSDSHEFPQYGAVTSRLGT